MNIPINLQGLHSTADLFFLTMANHIKISFQPVNSLQRELLVARLSEHGFDGFEEGNDFLLAYCVEENFDEELVVELSKDIAPVFLKELVEEQNWNENWEKNFQPVLVGNFCAIRASFHPEIKEVEHNIIITPKMSFGTGHHATTYMMVQWMQQLDFKNKIVLDFGTGTGVLAILAEKLGASSVVAIDNDDWSIENASENILFNDCNSIVLQKSDRLRFEQQFDIILANINRNVLLANMESLQQHLKRGGVLLMSGLLAGDREVMEGAAGANKLSVVGELQKDNWISLQLTCY